MLVDVVIEKKVEIILKLIPHLYLHNFAFKFASSLFYDFFYFVEIGKKLFFCNKVRSFRNILVIGHLTY